MPATAATANITVPTDRSASLTGSAVANTNEGSGKTHSLNAFPTPRSSDLVTANDVSGIETNATVTIALDLSTLITDVDASETLTNVVITFTGDPAEMTGTHGSLPVT